MNKYFFANEKNTLYIQIILVYFQEPLFLEFDNKIKLGDKLINVRTIQKKWGLYTMNSGITSRVLRILAS